MEIFHLEFSQPQTIHTTGKESHGMKIDPGNKLHDFFPVFGVFPVNIVFGVNIEIVFFTDSEVSGGKMSKWESC